MATETITKANVTSAAQGQTPEPDTALLGAGTEKATADQPDEDATLLGSEPADKAEVDTEEPAKDDKKPEAEVDETIAEDFEFEVPEGEEATGETLAAYRDLARELELPKSKAQSLLSKMLPVIREQTAKQLQAKATETFETWRQEAIKDKEFGGPKLKESVELGNEALAHYFGDSFREWLVRSGGGNRADVVRGFAKLGRDLRSDAFVQGAARRGGAVDLNDPASQARKLFPNDS